MWTAEQDRSNAPLLSDVLLRLSVSAVLRRGDRRESRNVRYALACRDATNQALKNSEVLRNSALDWLRHDKLKHIGHLTEGRIMRGKQDR
jgi:hypothetical protein